MEGWTDDAILAEMGARLRRERLDRNLTQSEVARRSGVSEKTIVKVENGHNSSVSTLIRILRALGMLGRIDALLPEPGLSPIAVARLRGKVRQRARSGG
jgi:transcriptional regulator with XRE-family HTH domain